MAEISALLEGFPGRSERGSLGWSACYLVATSSGQRLLFDTGSYNERAAVAAKLARRGIARESVDLLVLSHLHFNHAANWDLFPNAHIMVHSSELEYAASAQADGAVLRFQAQALREERRVHVVSGDQITLTSELTLLHLPGHTPGCIALAVEGAILCGDALRDRWELEVAVPQPCWNEASAMRSIDRLKSSGAVLYPGHDVPLDRVNGLFQPRGAPRVRIFFPDRTERNLAAPGTGAG